MQFWFVFVDVESPSPEPDGEFKSTAPPLDLVFTTNPSLLQTNGTLPHAGGIDVPNEEDDEFVTPRYELPKNISSQEFLFKSSHSYRTQVIISRSEKMPLGGSLISPCIHLSLTE